MSVLWLLWHLVVLPLVVVVVWGVISACVCAGIEWVIERGAAEVERLVERLTVEVEYQRARRAINREFDAAERRFDRMR